MDRARPQTTRMLRYETSGDGMFAHVQHMMETWAAFFDAHLPPDGARAD
jgi:hypothetical protein